MILDGTKDEWRERGKNLDCQTKDKRDKRRRGDEDILKGGNCFVIIGVLKSYLAN